MQALYTFSGIVLGGAQRGKDLGFPTANIKLTQEIPEGIYAAHVWYENTKYNAATFIGKAVTFGETEYKSETYILDFNENIYGKTLQIALFKKIRGNSKFASEKELIEQMEKDIVEIKNILEK